MGRPTRISEMPAPDTDFFSLERKTYMEMSCEEMDHMMKQAVISRDTNDSSGYAAMFDGSGRSFRHYATNTGEG